ncbi:hypothetical protein DXG01_008175 [Tephrocybe rancida]|nr:hypothetical protein DXG01_008175 [Tephrocybe rancida]
MCWISSQSNCCRGRYGYRRDSLWIYGDGSLGNTAERYRIRNCDHVDLDDWVLVADSNKIAVGSQLRATNGAATPFGSNCQVQSFVFWTPLSHGLSFLFNLTILVFMVMKVREKRGQPSRTLRAAYTDSMILIAIATGASATILIIHSLGPDYQLVKQISMPFCTLITATMGARVFIILRIAPPVVTDGRVPVTNFQYATTVTQHVDSDKVAYVMGNPSPIPPPKDEKYDSTMSPSSYTASPSSYTASPSSYTKSPDSYTALSTPPQKYLSASSPSSASSSPQPQYMSPQRLIPAESPAFKAAPVAVPELQHNEYTTFPDPPSPPQAPQLHMRDGSIDSATPLLQTKFGIHIGPKKPKLRKKEDYSLKKDDYSSGWV